MIEKKAVQFSKIIVSGDGIPEISPEETLKNAQFCKVIDVRRPDEFNAELGHIEGAKLVTLGPDLLTEISALNPSESIIFVCRSGGRSGQATLAALQKGLKHAVNMSGGMLSWNEKGLPVSRS